MARTVPGADRGSPRELTGHAGAVTALAWAPDGRLLATSADPHQATDRAVRVWSAEGALVAVLEEHRAGVTALAWAPDGTLLATGASDATVRLWAPRGDLVATLTAPPAAAGGTEAVFRLAWAPDGQTLAAGGTAFPAAPPGTPRELPGVVRLWRRDGTLHTTLATRFTGGKFLNLGWSPDGTLLAAGAVDYRVWRADGTPVAVLRDGGPGGTPAWGFAWAPDGRRLAIGDENGTLLLCAPLGAPLARLRLGGGIDGLGFSPDGAWLAATTLGAVRLLRPETPEVGARSVPSATGVPVAWANGVGGDGVLAVVAPEDDQVHLWWPDRATEGPAVRLAGCAGPLTALAWAPEGRRLAAGSTAARACLWSAGLPPAR